jgi:thioredoxin 1
MKNIIELTEANFEQEVLKAEGPVVVDFYAPWCGPCKMLAPLLEQLAGELAGKLKFVKLNVDEAPVLAGRYDITGVPARMLFRGGNVVAGLWDSPGHVCSKCGWTKRSARQFQLNDPMKGRTMILRILIGALSNQTESSL